MARYSCATCNHLFLESDNTIPVCPKCYSTNIGEFPVPKELAGTKYDSDKPRMELIDSYAIEQLALVLTFGAKKYGEWNWTKGLSYSRLIGAALRHLFAFASGQDKDDESGLPHLSHCFCCLMMLVAMTKRHPNLDDRNKGIDNE